MEIYILMQSNGEQYEDYREYVIDLYSDKVQAETQAEILNNPEVPEYVSEEDYYKVDDDLMDYDSYKLYIEQDYYQSLQQKAWVVQKTLKH